MKDLMEFLDEYGLEYRVEGDRVVVDGEVILSGRRIEELPESIGSLKCNFLNLSNNELTILPDSIAKVRCEILFVSYNKLKSLPENIGDLKCKELYLYNNQLESLPESFGRLKCRILGLSDNPLEQCLWLFKDWNDRISLMLKGTVMYIEGARKVGDYRKEIDLAHELRKPDNAGIKSMFDMGLF